MSNTNKLGVETRAASRMRELREQGVECTDEDLSMENIINDTEGEENSTEIERTINAMSKMFNKLDERCKLFFSEMKEDFNKKFESMDRNFDQQNEKINDLKVNMNKNFLTLQEQIIQQERTTNEKLTLVEKKIMEVTLTNETKLNRVNETVEEIKNTIGVMQNKSVLVDSELLNINQSIAKLNIDFDKKHCNLQSEVEGIKIDLNEKITNINKTIPNVQPTPITLSALTQLKPPSDYYFSDFTEKIPHKFLDKLESEYKSLHAKDRWKELVETRLKGKAYLWWCLSKDNLNEFSEFICEFKSKFCGPDFKQYAMIKLNTGGYFSNKQGPVIDYLTDLLQLAMSTDLFKNEKELTKLIANHFHSQITQTIYLKDYSTVNELVNYLENIPDEKIIYKESYQYQKDNMNVEGYRTGPKKDYNKNNYYYRQNRSSYQDRDQQRQTSTRDTFQNNTSANIPGRNGNSFRTQAITTTNSSRSFVNNPNPHSPPPMSNPCTNPGPSSMSLHGSNSEPATQLQN